MYDFFFHSSVITEKRENNKKKTKKAQLTVMPGNNLSIDQVSTEK